MGVRHLNTFIQKYVPQGFVEVSIKDECIKFANKTNGTDRPILAVDLTSLEILFSQDKIDLLCGTRHNILLKNLDLLFQNLKVYADLVFYERGPTRENNLETTLESYNERYSDMINILECICDQTPIEEIWNKRRPWSKELPRITCMVDAIHAKAKEYGKVTVTYGQSCYVELVRYATSESKVLAIVACDSDFLVFPGTFRFFSARELDIDTLKTKEYNRKMLRKHLKLDDIGLAVLSTLAGNRCIWHERLQKFHDGFRRDATTSKFPALAKYVKSNLMSLKVKDIKKEIRNILREHKISMKTIIKSLGQYSIQNIKYVAPILSQSMRKILDFCKENDQKFVYQVLRGFPTCITYLGMQNRNSSNYKRFLEITLRQIGVVVKNKVTHRHFEMYRHKVIWKESHETSYGATFKLPIYPPIPGTSLLELLNRDEYPEHDDIRVDLFTWMVFGKVKDVDVLSTPRKYLLDILVLLYLTQEKLITDREADIILFTIAQMERDEVLVELEPPKKLHNRAFSICFLYSEIHHMISNCFKIVGLGDYTKLLNFDGVLFHNSYWRYIDEMADTSSLNEVLNMFVGIFNIFFSVNC